tara:strand:- start:1380 stop:1682 length:303 start_codon:yes stop_codon:yes gene_type:complete
MIIISAINGGFVRNLRLKPIMKIIIGSFAPRGFAYRKMPMKTDIELKTVKLVFPKDEMEKYNQCITQYPRLLKSIGFECSLYCSTNSENKTRIVTLISIQ